jgi:hypothetical protein
VTTPAERLIAKLKSDAFNAELRSQSEEKMRRREQRRKELREKQITTETRVVAWIDILGFSQQLQNSETSADLQAAYRKVLFVHEWFNKESASDEPESRAETNEIQGRTVLALSDGLVVTAGLSKKALSLASPYDLLMKFISDIVMAQAGCVLEGIFLRGGISIGPFHFENDILLSPALVRSYKLESERAIYPVIVIPYETVSQLKTLPGVEAYGKGANPFSYFRSFKSQRRSKGEQLYFLDYLRYIADAGSLDSVEDRDAYLDKSKSPEERQRILDRSIQKSVMKMLLEHRKQVIAAYRGTSTEKVKKKYRWLAKYHNDTLANLNAAYSPAWIDLNQLKS